MRTWAKTTVVSGMLCVLLMPTLAAAQEGSFLTPGQIGPSCGSFLTPGALRACKKKLAEKKAEQKIQQRPQAQSLSARLKAFYQHYGKPPVAAAKALLDPTPQNIKAWALEEVRSQDNAAMVAAELTAEEKRIERKAEAVPTAELEAAKIPTIYADDMKVILWSRTNDCPECLAMTHTLQALAVENPSMIVQEELVGEDSLADAINFAAHSGLDFPVFPSNKKAALQRGIDSVPTIVLDDLEYHRSYVIRAPLNIASLRQGIMAFRNFNMRHPAKTGVR